MKLPLFKAFGLILTTWAAAPLHGEFLFVPENPTTNGFFTPTIEYIDWEYEYSMWDVFYSPYTAPNYPDIFAPYGGEPDYDGEGNEVWKPTEWNPSYGIPAHPQFNPATPYAFWDSRNATITQTQTRANPDTVFIIGPDATGNIYSFQIKTAYQLHNKPVYDAGLGMVMFQFQTDGTNADFRGITLRYRDGEGNLDSIGIDDLRTEYLREYSTTRGDHWSATAGYRNRVLFQWDLSGVAGVNEFWIEWESLSSSMSFQKADLLTASYYSPGMPLSGTLGDTFTNAVWSGGEYWKNNSAPEENGNLFFKNTAPSTLEIDDQSHVVGEIVFVDANDVTITSLPGHRLIANTGVTTRSTLPNDGVYTFNVDYELGALNFFEINTGKVVMNGEISGNYGIVKLGDGVLEFHGDNTFTEFLAVQGGDLVLYGSNQYSGSTNVVNGRLIVANEAALGSSTSPLMIGGDADLYRFTTGAWDWLAELLIDGDLEIDRNIVLGAGDLGKRLGAFNTSSGAHFSGTISFSGVVANPDAESSATAVGNTRITAQEATDRLIFSGAMTGGDVTKTVTLDGLGEVVYRGAHKTYAVATRVNSGRLLIEAGTNLQSAGSVTVAAGAELNVQGGITGSGAVLINGGVATVDGTISGSGAFTFHSGVLKGSGTIAREFTVAGGAIIAPGNSVGTLHTASQTWGGGGVYLWEMSSAVGVEGTDWDFLDITGDLTLTASALNPFEIQIASLGEVIDFDSNGNYDWLIARASEGINGFDPAAFRLNLASFAPAYTGEFTLSFNFQGELFLAYRAIPEPSSSLLVVSGLALAAWQVRRRKLAKSV